jgi:hypothetical protein
LPEDLTDEAIVAALPPKSGLSAEKVSRLRRIYLGNDHVDATYPQTIEDDDPQGALLLQAIADTEAEVDDDSVRKQQTELVFAAVASLSPRQRRLVLETYGLPLDDEAKAAVVPTRMLRDAALKAALGVGLALKLGVALGVPEAVMVKLGRRGGRRSGDDGGVAQVRIEPLGGLGAGGSFTHLGVLADRLVQDVGARLQVGLRLERAASTPGVGDAAEKLGDDSSHRHQRTSAGSVVARQAPRAVPSLISASAVRADARVSLPLATASVTPCHTPIARVRPSVQGCRTAHVLGAALH